MYNQKIKQYKIDRQLGDMLTVDEITTFINHHTANIVPVMDKLDNYGNGYNETIKAIDDKPSDIPNNRKSYGYGKRIVDTTTNYLIANPAKYSAQDQDYMQEISNVHQVNNIGRENKEVIYNLVRFGQAGKVYYYDNDALVRFASVDPRQFVAVYNYDVNPELVCVVSYYSISDLDSVSTSKSYVSVYYPETVEQYEGATISDIRLVDSKPHDFKQVPFCVYGGCDYSGMLYSVLDQIDAYDLLQNGNLNEVEKFNLAYMIFNGVDVTPEDLQIAKEAGAFVIPPSAGGKDAISYLTKTINAEFNVDVRDNAKQEIYDLSTVPNFTDKDFSADSGVALRYKLMGFDNSARQIEELFKYGEQNGIDIITASIDSSWQSREQYLLDNQDRIVQIELIENIPTDTGMQLQNASMLKALGLPIAKIIDALPADIVGLDKQALIDEMETTDEQDAIVIQDEVEETE